MKMGKIQSRKVTWIMALCSIFFASASHAMDFVDVFMLQSTMAEHGFDSGEPDGRIGPATRRAIAGFSEKYDLPEDPDTLLEALVSRSIAHSIAITREVGISDSRLEEIKDGVAELLRDPSSVQIRDVRIVENPKGRFYCGEVNGKNAYGGYAGFMNFMSIGTTYNLFYIQEPDSKIVYWECNMAIPKKK